MFPLQWQSAIDKAKKTTDDKNFVSQIKDSLSGKGDFGFDLKAGEQVLQSKLDMISQMETANSTQAVLPKKESKPKNPYSGFAGGMALQAGIQPEEIEANKPVGRLATAGMLATAAFPSKGIGMISEGIPGAKALMNLSGKNLNFVKSLFRDLENKPIFNNPLYHDAPRGTKVLDGIILDGSNLGKHSDDIRQKLSSIGYKDVNDNLNLSLIDEDNPLVKNGIEIVFENPNGKALNVYMRTDGKKTVMTFDETAMDTGGKFHTNNNYVPKFVKDLYSHTKIKSSLPVYQGETDLTTKLLEKLKGRTEVSKQFISDLTNAPDLKQVEKDVIRNVLDTHYSNIRPLAQEATKYKSAEEFVKAQPKLYHSGTADIKQVDLNKTNFNKTFYLSDKPEYAKSFGGKNTSINEMVLDQKANLADMRKPSNELVLQIEKIAKGTETGKTITIPKPDGTSIKLPTTPKDRISFSPYSIDTVIQGIKDGKAHFAELPEVKKILQKLGYDGQITSEVPYAKNIGIWNKDIIKTKSQLTDIWNKANKGVAGKKLNITDKYLGGIKNEYDNYVKTFSDSPTLKPVSFEEFVKFKGIQEVSKANKGDKIPVQDFLNKLSNSF